MPPLNQSVANIAQEEHDNTFGLKKVELFGQTGSGRTLVAVSSGGAISTVPGACGTLTSGTATNNSAGTAVQLPSVACSLVRIF